MKFAILTMVGSVAGFLVALSLGFVAFGIGLAQDLVYTIPGLWRAGVEPTDQGFNFVLSANMGGILMATLVGALVGLLIGVRKRSRSRV